MRKEDNVKSRVKEFRDKFSSVSKQRQLLENKLIVDWFKKYYPGNKKKKGYLEPNLWGNAFVILSVVLVLLIAAVVLHYVGVLP